MKHLILKLNTEGQSGADVAALLRELAAQFETGDGPAAGVLTDENERVIGRLSRPAKAPAVERKPKAEVSIDTPRRFTRGIKLAADLRAELETLHAAAKGAESLVLYDMLEPAERLRQRLALLEVVTAEEPAKLVA